MPGPAHAQVNLDQDPGNKCLVAGRAGCLVVGRAGPIREGDEQMLADGADRTHDTARPGAGADQPGGLEADHGTAHQNGSQASRHPPYGVALWNQPVPSARFDLTDGAPDEALTRTASIWHSGPVSSLANDHNWRDDIAAAAQRIEGFVRRTPTLALDANVVLKLEQTQHTGSFKPRGAFNFVLSQPTLPAAGIIAASGGNHGQAVAYVARSLGLAAEVFVPEVCPAVKRARIAALGARVVVGGAIYDDAQAACHRRAAETGALVVLPFDDAAIIAGAGTVARELQLDWSNLDTVLVAAGGGGLMSGALAWYQGEVAVVAVEPERSRALWAALDAGAPVDVEVGGVAADSLGARRIGALPFALAQRFLASSVTVSDADIVAAQRHLWDQARIVTEPGGATAYAALLSGAYQSVRGERVGVIVCGANVELSAGSWSS